MYSGGTVCDDGLYWNSGDDKTVEWICRLMGYESLDYWANGLKYAWQENYPIILDDVQCAGSEIPQCRYLTYHNCGHGEDVWLSCNIRKQRGDLNSFYLLDNTEVFTQSGHGLLMYQGGTVSYDGFDDSTANWICRLMGYEDAADWVNDRQFSFQDDLPIKLNNLVCSTTSYSDILPSCQSTIRTADDSHDEDIWIWCNSVVIAECPAGYKVKLENKLCQECPPTTYSPTPNIDLTCLQCPEGSSSPAASPYCTCVGGSYLSADYSSCQACPTGTASKEGSMSSGQCVLCPVGTISIDDGKACSCNKGYGWLWTSDEEGTCNPCPVNSFKLRTQGTCRQCPVEATSLPLSEHCICAEGLSWNGEGCVNCVAEISEDNVCGCDAGTFWSTYSNTCEECPKHHYSKKYSASCSKCPVYTVSNPNSTECHSCPNGLFWKDFTCLQCPEGSSSPAASPYCTCVGGSYLSADYSSCQACPTGTVSQEGSMSSGQCVLCPVGTISIDDGKACSCNKGYGWLWTSDEEGTCNPCPVNSFKLRTQGTCRQCPVEATSLPLSEHCICAEGLSWNGEGCVNCVAEISEDNVCGCDAGTFWSTYSNTCEECPKNHYSKKYSESCSKCPVYTVSKPKSTECHSCPIGLFWKDFDCSIDILLIASLLLSLLVIVLLLPLVIWSKITSRNVSNLKMSYSPEPCRGTSPPDPCGTVQLSGRKCMCPDCPCSARPALPPRDAVIQDDDLYMNHACS